MVFNNVCEYNTTLFNEKYYNPHISNLLLNSSNKYPFIFRYSFVLMTHYKLYIGNFIALFCFDYFNIYFH